MAHRTMYQIVGRYMNGTEVTGYHLQCIENGKDGRYTREQTVYLVGRDQITNCTGQIYQDKVLLRGRGISLESDIPTYQDESGVMNNTENLGKVKRGADAASAMTQLNIAEAIVYGRKTVGYTVRNVGGATKPVSRKKAIEMIQNNRIGNARVQKDVDGKPPIIRGVNCNLNELPIKRAEDIPGFLEALMREVNAER